MKTRPKNGIRAIDAERRRQQRVERWTAAHDDQHNAGELAHAASCYAYGNVSRWPWAISWWKPGEPTVEGRMRDMEKAGALCAAEWDRLNRLLKKMAK